MARRIHVAPNRPDCRIECDGPGFACYVDPNGPCLTECGESAVAALLAPLLLGDGTAETTMSVAMRLDARSVETLLLRLREGSLDDRAATARDGIEQRARYLRYSDADVLTLSLARVTAHEVLEGIAETLREYLETPA